MSKEKSETTLKISAVIIALILWAYVMSVENPVGTWEHKDIDVSFNSVETLEKSGLVIMNPKEANVSVTVSGKRSDRVDFSTDDIRAEVDLAGYSEGQRKVPVKVTLNQSSNMKITDWEPREILFDFDKLVSQEKPASIKTSGKLPAGYVLGDISIKPKLIELRGPKTLINEVDKIIADLDLTNIKGDINVTLPIKLIDNQGETVMGVKNEPNIIDVSIPVYSTKKVAIEVNTVNQLPDNYEVTNINVNPSSITLKGEHDLVDMKSIQTKPIDINSLIDNGNVEVELDLPEDVSLLDPNKKITVSLKVEESVTKTYKYSFEEIAIRNLAPELKIDMAEIEKELINYSNTIDVTLRGEKGEIEKLSKEDIVVYMDLKDLDKGEKSVDIKVDLPSNLGLSKISPQALKLNLIDK